MRKITLLRRTIQTVFFLLILYGGFLGMREIDVSVLPFIESPSAFGQEQKIEPVRPAGGHTQIFDTYLPPKTCRFIVQEPRAVRACALYFFSESITWMEPLKYILPHILLFVILSFLLGRLWCGWLCPLGFVSDILGIIRKYLRLTYFNLSVFVQSFLIKFKYGFLILIGLTSLIIAFPAMSAYQKDFFMAGCQTCPARILFPLLGGQIPVFYSFDSPILSFFSSIGIVFLLIFLFSFFVRRFWCRICPTGALISFFNLGGAMTKEKNVLRCTKCGICARVCPVQNKKVYEEKKNENICDKNCIRCFKCVEMCPETDCLKIKLFDKILCRSKFTP